MKTHAIFRTTRWTLIRHADAPDHLRARKALEELLQLYLDPIYAFIRRRGHGREDAEELVLGFLAHAVERGTLAKADPTGGDGIPRRFRTFVLACLDSFLKDDYRRKTTAKRGGKDLHTKQFSFDSLAAEERYAVEPVDDLSPDKLLTRKMTLQMIESVVQELRAEFAAEGRATLFDALYAVISQDDSADGYQALSARLNLSISDLKSKTHRLRKRFKALYEDRVAELCDSDDAAKAEAIALEDSL